MSTVPVLGGEADQPDPLLLARTTLIEQFNSTGDPARALLQGTTTVLDLVPAPAAALYLEGRTSTIGEAPDVARIEEVVDHLRSARRRLPFASESLATEHPRLAALLPEVAGLLIVPIDGARGCLAWFRPEQEATENHDDRIEPGSGSSRSGGGGSSRRAEPWDGLADAAARFSRDLDGAILRNLHSHLAQFGFHDALTGLANSRLLTDRIQHALDGPTRGAGVTLLLIDINSFTGVNTSFGHAGGDEMLIQVAERLRSVTRDSDTLARLAGDEFAVLAAGADRVGASRIAERVITSLERPFTLSGRQIRVTASIGATEAETEDTPAEMLQRAHVAMEWAKQFGRNDQVARGLRGLSSKAAFVAGRRIHEL